MKQIGVEGLARDDAGLGVVVGKSSSLVEPLPEDAQSNLPGGHILHQIENIVVTEEVGRLERRSLKATTKGVTVL